MISEQVRVNAFPISLPQGTMLTYRFWTVDPAPTTLKLQEKIRGYLWRAKLRRPVFRRTIDGQFGFVIADWGTTEVVEYVGEGERRYRIAPTDILHTIAVDNLQENDIDLAIGMLQQEFMLHLRNNAQLVRGHRADQFFIVTPDVPTGGDRRAQRPYQSTREAIDIYRGFTFRVTFLAQAGLCVVVDLMTSYIGRTPLAAYLAQHNRPRFLERGAGLERWVNDYGRVKQSVYLLRVLNQTIGDIRLKDGRTVYEYLQTERREIAQHISPGDVAATVVYKTSDVDDEHKHYTAAATLLKPKFAPQSREVRAIGDSPAFAPHERLRRIEDVRHFFYGVRFAGASVRIGTSLDSVPQVFPLPGLLFGPPDGRHELNNNPALPPIEARQRLGTQKMEALRQHGPYIAQAFTNPSIVYPVSLEESGLLDKLLQQTQKFCSTYGRVDFDPTFSSYRDDAHPRDIIRKLQGIESQQRTGFILLALPERTDTAAAVYAGAKALVKIPSKCFATAKLKERAGNPDKLGVYLDRNALGMLVENGTRPWALATPLHYELHFGFDVARTSHGGLMGAAVVDGATGSAISFGYEEIDAAERIPTKSIRSFVREQLELYFQTHGRLPASILFQRDGRLLDTEIKGIRAAMQRVSKEHPECASPAWAAVVIEKTTSAPLRLFLKQGHQVERPLSGTYLLQHTQAGYVILAGAPTLKQGSPRPIRVELIDASSDAVPEIVPILQDIFWLSRLNWNSPDIDIRLPITLRFTDQKLERYALEAVTDDDDGDWEEEEEEGEPEE